LKHRLKLPVEPGNASDKARDVSGALLAAFRDCISECGSYDRLTVREVIARANVARSTFYEHFEDKSDILRHSIGPLFSVIAQCVLSRTPSPHLVPVLEHFAQNRRLGESFMRGSGRDLLLKFLAEEVERCLLERRRTRPSSLPSLIPLSLAAQQVAAAQLALMNAWVHEDRPLPAADIAVVLIETSQAMACAVLRDENRPKR
jgi:AcrR family transcriptional regulator